MGRVGNGVAKWSPRILGLLFAAFLALFALDSRNVLELLIHLIPSMVIVLGVFVGWRWPPIGGILFLGLALAATVFFKTYRHALTLLLVTGPFVAVGTLFLLHWRLARSRDAAPG